MSRFTIAPEGSNRIERILKQRRRLDDDLAPEATEPRIVIVQPTPTSLAVAMLSDIFFMVKLAVGGLGAIYLARALGWISMF